MRLQKYLFVLLLMVTTTNAKAQQNPYYYQIPDTPAVYTPETVAARMVDGLGFRYFWATSGLTDEDLLFKPGDSARTTFETLEHIHGLTQVLLNAVSGTSTKSGGDTKKLSFSEMRAQTLKNIESASKILKKPQAKLADFDMVFEGANGKTRYPFWNLINGPVSDALWHVGQVVSFRRSSGNPLPKGVNVLAGKKSN
ncbi:MAG: hypothetical protein IPL84_14135 [Chitinophagaceae bacterium]|nr:hypothetical protein [Chitinophagaceae bacterium]